jgi:hypothetical protein
MLGEYLIRGCSRKRGHKIADWRLRNADWKNIGPLIRIPQSPIRNLVLPVSSAHGFGWHGKFAVRINGERDESRVFMQ